MKTVAFHSNQLGLRGDAVAMYAYAKYNETILQNRSIIISDRNASYGLESFQKFNARFPTYLYTNFSEAEKFCEKENVSHFYALKAGDYDGKVINGIKNLIHVMFRHKHIHGNKYVYISEWLAKYMGNDLSFVPHIVESLPEVNTDYREQLGISKNSLVFGCFGGKDSFNIPFVKESVIKTASKNKNIYFVFMNIDSFSDLPNIIHLPGSYDLNYKSSFINTCDAMIHARWGGETFGLAVAEFSSKNKPVITYKDSVEAAHIDMLGDVGIYYSEELQLMDLFSNFKDYRKDINYDVYTERFSPKNVMEIFNKEFLWGRIRLLLNIRQLILGQKLTGLKTNPKRRGIVSRTISPSAAVMP
jgi:hypothetical protein